MPSSGFENPDVVTVISPTGEAVDVPVEMVGTLGPDYRVETPDEAYTRRNKQYREERSGGPGLAFAVKAMDAASLGTIGAMTRASFGDSGAESLRDFEEFHPVASMAGTVAGSLVSPAGQIGGALSKTATGASALTKVGKAAAGYGAEGAVVGLGSGVSELAMSKDPLSVERVASVLSSNVLLGGAVGGVAGAAGKAAELGLQRTKNYLDDAVANRASFSGDATQTSIADDVIALKNDIKTTNQFATTKGVKLEAVEGKATAAELGRLGAKYERQISTLTDNPIALSKGTVNRRLLEALQGQEHAYVKMLDRADDLKAAYAVDGMGGKRLAALEAVPGLLEKNRALQAKLGAVMEAGAPKPVGMAEQMLGGMAFSVAASQVGDLPIPGAGLLAPIAGAKFAKMVGERVFGRMGKATSEVAQRTQAAVDRFLDVGTKAAKYAPPAATKVLAAVRYAPPTKNEEGDSNLASLYAKRSGEIRSLTTYNAEGKVEMRPEARAQIANQLSPIRTVNPILADRIESVKARGVEFLAEKMPKKPDIFGMPLGGPDRWKPSELEMRTWARYVSAVEDPGGVEERLADGIITPEDAEAYRTVYPERYAALVNDVISRMGQLRKELPYGKRLALSIFTDKPVDPSTDPRILAGLQAQYTTEPEAPKATPQFGSVKATEEATAAQKRAG